MINFATGISHNPVLVYVRIKKAMKLIKYKEMCENGKLQKIRTDIFYAAGAML